MVEHLTEPSSSIGWSPIVYPTTTLPALGCLPEADALDRLFELKKRSGRNSFQGFAISSKPQHWLRYLIVQLKFCLISQQVH